MRSIKIQKRVIAMMMAVLMVAAVSTMSAFAGSGGAGSDTNPYFFYYPEGSTTLTAAPHGQNVVAGYTTTTSNGTTTAVITFQTGSVTIDGVGTFPVDATGLYVNNSATNSLVNGVATIDASNYIVDGQTQIPVRLTLSSGHDYQDLILILAV